MWANAMTWGVEPPQQHDKFFLQNARRMEEGLHPSRSKAAIEGLR